MPDFAHMSFDQLLRPEGYQCSCGRFHGCTLRKLLIGRGVIRRLPEVLREAGIQKPYLVMDANTRKAAGDLICSVLDDAKIPYGKYCFPQERVEPDEFAVGQVTMNLPLDCDWVMAIGGGSINDVCKMLCRASGMKLITCGTAPSMDGYASNSSSMIRAGVKVTIYSVCPTIIVADTEIMAQAPMRMLQSGMGDVVAKYVSVCDWRISHVINDEYYCEDIAQMMRAAVKKCVDSAEGYARRDPDAVQAVVEGLILSGMGMAFAQVSRPASGLEHYFSHIWEMRAFDAGKRPDFHGIQVGVGTHLVLRLYEWLKKEKPDREKALAHAKAFDFEAWSEWMRKIFPNSCEELIELEKQVKKHDPELHAKRLETILDHWDEIMSIASEELPNRSDLEKVYRTIGEPMLPSQIGVSLQETREALYASMEIRDKYICSRLLWDLGLIDEYADKLIYDVEQAEKAAQV